MYYDRQGRLIGGVEATLEWGKRFEKATERRVAEDSVDNSKGEFWVSTVWLGLDHNWGFEGPPLIFETMVFSKDEADGLYMERYATEEQAVEGHKEIVEWVRAGLLPEDADEREAAEEH